MYEVLIVDDDVDWLSALSEVLEDSGQYRVVAARTGEAALALMGRQRFDLVLLDISMPGMGGIDVAARVRQNTSDLGALLVFLTGLVTAADMQNTVMGEGREPILAKTLSPPALLHRLESLLEGGLGAPTVGSGSRRLRGPSGRPTRSTW